MTRLAAVVFGLGLACTALAADDVFVCAPGTLENGTQDSWFKDKSCVEANSVGFGTSSLVEPGGPPGTPPVDVGPVVILLNVDASFPALGALALSGDALPELTLHVRKTGTVGAGDLSYLILSFESARIGELVITQTGDDVPTLRLVVRWSGMEWTWRPVDDFGNLGAPLTFSWPQGS